MPPHRKKPFSITMKKKQLQTKRERKRNQERDEDGNVIRQHKGKHRTQELPESDESGSGHDDEHSGLTGQRLNQQPKGKTQMKGYDPNRYRLHFARDSEAEIAERKQQSYLPYTNLPEEALEMDLDMVYVPGSVLDMPKRPPWDYKTGKHAVVANEERYFKEYLDKIIEHFTTEQLSYFELNLETWRQLWRVIEMADIVLLITDIRHPVLHFSPAMYSHVTEELQKPMILVLNKIDLAPPALVAAWTHYLRDKFPELTVIYFTSFPKDKAENDLINDPGKVLQKTRKRGTFTAVGHRQLYEACEKLTQGKVDLTTWREKIEHEIAGVEPVHQSEIRLEETDDVYHKHEAFRDGILTIGCCGYPNVGKSSIINGLMGKKVVSVSKTPGHTKHFQTIYLSPTVKLCDSPGLVFPSLVPKPLQILAGIYPIAQVREPYTAVMYLAERLDVPHMLRLTHPEAGDKERTPRWAAVDICDAWAQKRGFRTAKAARHDIYRAANHILRLAVTGRLCLCARPPGYTARKDYWTAHPDSEEIARLQDLQRSAGHPGAGVDEGEEVVTLSDSDLEDTEPRDGESEDEDESDDDGGCGSNVASSNPFALLADD